MRSTRSHSAGADRVSTAHTHTVNPSPLSTFATRNASSRLSASSRRVSSRTTTGPRRLIRRPCTRKEALTAYYRTAGAAVT